MMKLGDFLRRYREEHGMSTRDFAALSGLTAGYISMVENDRNPNTGKPIMPTARTYKKIAAATGIPFDELLRMTEDAGAAPSAAPPPVASAPKLSGAAQRVALLYQSADERDRRLVDVILEPYARSVPTAEKTPPASAPLIFPKARLRRRPDGFTETTVYDQPPAAGFGNYLETPTSHIEQYPDGAIPEGTSFGTLVSGQSMEPYFPDGATVFVQSASFINDGEVGLFSLNGNAYIKQLVVDRTAHTVHLHSLNPAYPDVEVHELDDLRTFGRVLGCYPEGAPLP